MIETFQTRICLPVVTSREKRSLSSGSMNKCTEFFNLCWLDFAIREQNNRMLSSCEKSKLRFLGKMMVDICETQKPSDHFTRTNFYLNWIIMYLTQWNARYLPALRLKLILLDFVFFFFKQKQNFSLKE